MDQSEKSVTWIVVAASILVLAMGWGFLAGSYSGAHARAVSEMSDDELDELKIRHRQRRRRSAVATFVAKSIEQLPNMPAVISWHFSNRIWLPILILLALAGVIGGGFVMKKVEQNLNQPRNKRR